MIRKQLLAVLPRGRVIGRPLRFGLVGLSGVAVNTCILWALLTLTPLPLVVASMIATEAAIVSNFLLNDRWTFPDRRGGPSPLVRLARFNGVALAGLLITVVALALLAQLPGLHVLVANVLAVGCATLWNYCASARWAWRSSP